MTKRRVIRSLCFCALMLSLCVVLSAPAAASSTSVTQAADTASSGGLLGALMDTIAGGEVEGATDTIEIILLITVLSLAPSILVLMTAFTRIVIILSFTRNAIGTQQMPPNQVLVGLSLFLTFFVMFPVFSQIKEQAWDPYAAEEITFEEAADLTIRPLNDFMLTQIRLAGNESSLRTFMGLAQMEELPESIEDIPTYVIIPAFVTSEIKVAFTIGFLIFIPFIVIDMVVASTLMSMGMMMLPPVMISLPFKIMLFLLVDGWNLTIGNIIKSFA